MTSDTVWLLTNLVAALLLPPLILIIIGTIGWFSLKRHPKLGKGLVGISLGLLFLLSTPLVAEQLLGLLEKNIHVPDPSARQKAQAIVILGGGIDKNAIEYGQDSVGSFTLERIQYGAFLHRQTGLPILVSGGNPGGGTPEAWVMRTTLEEEFGIPVQWAEARSMNTAQNAQFSASVLAAEGIHTVLVVSHAWHLARARFAFEKTGLKFIAAPTRFTLTASSNLEYEVFDFLPNPRALMHSYFAVRETIGLLWYRLTLM